MFKPRPHPTGRNIPSSLAMAIVLGLCAIAGRIAAAAPPADDTRPNVLFIFSDDHAYQAISAYGSGLNHTPNLDRIAKEGVRFDRCFVTNSLCGPARAVVQTGKYSLQNGFFSNGFGQIFDGSQQTFPKLMQKAGYQTAIIGKWHLVSDPQGYDYWNILFGQGVYYNPGMNEMGKLVRYTGYTTDILADLALNWMKNKRDPHKPFVLMVQNKAPHRDWQPPIKYLHEFDNVQIPEPATLFDDYAGRGTAEHTQNMEIGKEMMDGWDFMLKGPQGHLTPEQAAAWNAAYEPKNEAFRKQHLTGKALVRWKYQRFIKDYLRVIHSVDDNVGRLLDYLDQSGLSKNTIVIYSSDQGFFLGEHGWFDKRWIFKESLRTPLLVRWPGVIKPGTVDRDDIVSNLDFAETFLDVAGVKPPADMQGRSIVPVLRGHTPADWRKSFYYHYYEFPGEHAVHPHYGVVTKDFKLAHFYNGIDEWELFDLNKDPREMTSVYNDPAYADTVKSLTAELQRLQRQYDDTQPLTPLPKLLSRQMLRRASHEPLKEILHLATGRDKAPRNIPVTRSLLTVGAWCTPTQPDGVVLAYGGKAHGFSLYLKAGVPHFVIRENHRASKIVAPAALPMNQASHLMVTTDAAGELHLFVDGNEVAHAPGEILTRAAAEGLSIAADPGDHVGDYTTDLPFAGSLRDLRIYTGLLDPATLRDGPHH